jgi:hypothetical protein
MTLKEVKFYFNSQISRLGSATLKIGELLAPRALCLVSYCKLTEVLMPVTSFKKYTNSDFGWETDYPNSGCLWFSTVPQTKARTVP